jgi:hypothetical protein
MTMMEQKKKTYYVSVGTGEISQVKTASPWDYQIEATDDEIAMLREYFDSNYSAEWQGFFRAHVPYIQYHYDRYNDAVDQNLFNIYQMIYELGSDETKNQIQSAGILESLQKNTDSFESYSENSDHNA